MQIVFLVVLAINGGTTYEWIGPSLEFYMEVNQGEKYGTAITKSLRPCKAKSLVADCDFFSPMNY